VRRRNPLNPEELTRKIMLLQLTKQAKSARAQGKSLRAISKEIGVSEKKLKKLLGQAQSARAVDPRADVAQELCKTTILGNPEIADIVGATRVAVWKWCKDIPRSGTDVKSAVLDEYRYTSMSRKDLSIKYGIPKPTVISWCKGAKKVWFDTRKMRARRMCRDTSQSHSSIGKGLGVSGKTISSWCLGVERPTRKPARKVSFKKLKAIRMANTGYAYKDIADKLGVITNTISRWCGKRVGKTLYSPELVQKVREDFLTGEYTRASLAKKHGVSRATIGRWCNNRNPISKRRRGRRGHKQVADWKQAAKTLKSRGFNQAELARLLCDSVPALVNCSPITAVSYFADAGTGEGRSPQRTPPPALQEAMVELAKVLYPLPWKEAAEALVAKGYTLGKISHLLSKRLGVAHSTAERYLSGRRRASMETQQSIINISEDFYDVDPKTIRGYSPKKAPKIVTPLSPKELEKIIVDAQLKASAKDLRSQGMTKRKIIKELEISAIKLNSYLLTDEAKELEDRRSFALSLLEDYDLTVEEIAEKTGEKVSTVLGWVSGANTERYLLRARADDKEIANVVKLCRTTELSYNEIAALVKRNASTVRGWCVKAGAEGDRSDESEESLEAKRVSARALCKEDPSRSLSSISIEVGASDKAIKRWCKGIHKPKPRTPPGAKERALVLLQTTDLPLYKVGTRVGVSGSTIGKWHKKWKKLDPKYRKRKPKRKIRRR
jgi:transcriptional regulator with XRE-family HTH domain/transposase